MRKCVLPSLRLPSPRLTFCSSVQIIEIVQTAIKHGPSAFNTQSSRAVVLFGSKHEKFWNTAEERFKAAVSAEFFAQISPKLLQMKDAYG